MGRKPLIFLSLSVLLGLPYLWSHVDDPKEEDKLPPYQGPGYRKGAPMAKKGEMFPAMNVDLVAWMPLNEIAPNLENANDCWGYVSPSGREYAILGTNRGTGFIDITNPLCPNLLGFIEGPVRLWRDIKIYDQFAYSVSEGGGGIQVFDLTKIDNGTVTLVNTVDDQGTGRSHNVAIDTTSGFLYRLGGGDNGLRIYSLADPANPSFVADWSLRYVHDAQIHTFTSGPNSGRQIAYACAGFNGGFVMTGLTILDVTDKNNIQVLSHYEYPNGSYSHQGWLSDDGRYFYLNDELDEQDRGIPTTTHILDVSDLSNPTEVGTFTSGASAIDHNLYVRGNQIFQANYRSGLRIFDATNPTAPVESAYFDTYPADDQARFNSLWSVYPYFPSGIIIGSDIEKGLFIWSQGTFTTSLDLNGDNKVDQQDLNLCLLDWQNCKSNCRSDVTNDGKVNIKDALVLLNAINCQ